MICSNCQKNINDKYDYCPECGCKTVFDTEIYQNIIKKDQFLSIGPLIAGIILLFIALGDWSYGYYVFLRWSMLIICLYYIIKIYKKGIGQTAWYYIFAAIAILFNPIIPVYLYDKDIWTVINIAVIVILVIFYKLFKLAFYKH